MSKKGVFDQDFSEISDLDSTIDINDVLSRIPTDDNNEDDSGNTDDEDKKTKNDHGTDDDVLDVNNILESSLEEFEKDDSDDDEDDDNEDKGDTPASEVIKKENSSEAPLTVIFARDLMKQGLLSSFDEEDFINKSKELGEAEALRDLIKTEITSNIEAAKADLDEGYQSYLTLLEGGFTQEDAVSLTSLQKEFNAIKIEDLEEEDNETLRRKVITDYYKLTTQMPDSKIKRVVDRSIDSAEDIEESKEYLEEIKTRLKNQIAQQAEENKNQIKLNEQKQLQQLESLKESINSITEIIPGQEINKKTKDKMYDMLIKPVEDNQGRRTNALWAKRSEDPTFFDSRLAYLLETGFFEKNKPWNKIKNVKVTKEASELENYLSSNKNTASRTGRSYSDSPLESESLRKTIEATRSILRK